MGVAIRAYRMAMPLFVKPDPLDYWKVFLEKHVTMQPATQLAMPPATQLAIPIVTQLAIPIVTQLAIPGATQLAIPGATLPATPDVITHRLVGSSVAIRTEVVESLEN